LKGAILDKLLPKGRYIRVDIGLGVLIGVLAGYYGGWIDQLLARFTDLIFAFPTLLFLIMMSALFGDVTNTALSNSFLFSNGNGRLVIIFLSLALFVWPSTARLVRGQTLQIKQQQYIEAARTSGTNNASIILRHIIPNLLSIAIISATLDMAGTIGAEAGVSLLGLGIQSPGSSVGLMIASASPYITVHPWELMVPSVVLTIIILAFSFFGDAVQDAFEPQ
jgi:oligopeptide transport system permease protein